uniref:Uncharacterized protein n=1 Tax=Manihot esculenta TaxID=3983 RepID=A0A2C9WJS9_MANES
MLCRIFNKYVRDLHFSFGVRGHARVGIFLLRRSTREKMPTSFFKGRLTDNHCLLI